jgi:hypothetical protein
VTYLAGPITYTLPRHVYASTPELRAETAKAIAEWDACRSGLFVLTDDPNAEVQVVPTDGRTWVLLPLTSPKSTVYVGSDVGDASYPYYWLAHELGHTLNLVDHVFPNTDRTGYISTTQSTEDGYRGVMSYASTRDQWLGVEDFAMLREVFPLVKRATVPEVVR